MKPDIDKAKEMAEIVWTSWDGPVCLGTKIAATMLITLYYTEVYGISIEDYFDVLKTAKTELDKSGKESRT